MPSEHAGRRVGILTIACSLAAAGCAPRTLQLPSGAGVPLADAAAVHAQASGHCTGIRTLTAELALAGRAGDQKLRGRALAGFETPASMRLEGVAPFGPPAFILAARSGTATLLLPRDHRVLRDAAPEQILGALTGVALAPADLLAILTGCVVPAPKAIGGTQYGEDWRVLELEGGAKAYLRRAGATWQLRAAERDGWRVEYAPWQGTFPKSVRLIRASTPVVDMTAAISQLEANVPIDAAAFAVNVPGDALPITLDELRGAGPMRGSDSTVE